MSTFHGPVAGGNVAAGNSANNLEINFNGSTQGSGQLKPLLNLLLTVE